MSDPFMQVNLLPPERPHERYAFLIQGVGIGFFTILLITFVVLGWMQRENANHQIQLLSQTKDTVAQLQQEADKGQAGGQQVAASIAASAGLQPLARPLIQSITNVLPAGSSLTAIQFGTNAVTLSGNCGNLATLADYEDALGKLSTVKKVFVTNVTAGQDTLIFTLNMQLSGGTSS